MLGAFIIRFTHYYTDSVMYRMSDPATRTAVAPLLTTAPPAAGLRRPSPQPAVAAVFATGV
jgi:hypothetical protein